MIPCAYRWLLGFSLFSFSHFSHANESSFSGDSYDTYYVNAARAFAANQLDSAVTNLDWAERARPGQANAANLRGAIYTRRRDWPKAMAAFQKALQIQPDLPMAVFNLGEVYFLTRRYPEAKECFLRFLRQQPGNELGGYKVFLCALLSGDGAQAAVWAGRLDSEPGSPARYYAKAAQAFLAGNQAGGLEWVQKARQEYSADANLTFGDSLVELGYLQSGCDSPKGVGTLPAGRACP